MRVNYWVTMAALLLCLCLPANADPLRVAAAANLQKVLTNALLPAFEKKTGVLVVTSYGATKALAVQIENGDPVDIFISADTSTVQRLAGEHLVVSSTIRPYAIGHLVIWSRRDAPRHPSRLTDLAEPAYAHIAIANPKTAPYGRAAQEAFAKLGMTANIAPRLVQAETISQALQFAQSGNADVALTALSLVIDDKVNLYVVVDDKLHAPITQSLGLVKSTTQTTQALQLIDFLTGKDAAKIWKQYGYSLPTQKG